MNIFAGDGVIHFIGKKEFGKFMNGIPVTGGPARPLSPPPPPTASICSTSKYYNK